MSYHKTTKKHDPGKIIKSRRVYKKEERERKSHLDDLAVERFYQMKKQTIGAGAGSHRREYIPVDKRFCDICNFLRINCKVFVRSDARNYYVCKDCAVCRVCPAKLSARECYTNSQYCDKHIFRRGVNVRCKKCLSENCIRHTCEIKYCTNMKVDGSPHCMKHHCGKCTTPTDRFKCTKHICAIDRCINYRARMRNVNLRKIPYCSEHMMSILSECMMCVRTYMIDPMHVIAKVDVVILYLPFPGPANQLIREFMDESIYFVIGIHKPTILSIGKAVKCLPLCMECKTKYM